MGEVAFTVPWPPSVNRYYRHVGPRVLISKDGRLYRREIEARLGGLLREPLRGALALRADVCPPDRRRRDLDNLGKALLDSLQHAGVFLDDSQIDELHIERKEVEPGGSVRIYIKEIEMTKSQEDRIDSVNRFLARKGLDKETLAVCNLFMQGYGDAEVRFKLRMSPERLKQIKSEIAIGLVLDGVPAGGR